MLLRDFEGFWDVLTVPRVEVEVFFIVFLGCGLISSCCFFSRLYNLYDFLGYFFAIISLITILNLAPVTAPIQINTNHIHICIFACVRSENSVYKIKNSLLPLKNKFNYHFKYKYIINILKYFKYLNIQIPLRYF